MEFICSSKVFDSINIQICLFTSMEDETKRKKELSIDTWEPLQLSVIEHRTFTFHIIHFPKHFFLLHHTHTHTHSTRIYVRTYSRIYMYVCMWYIHMCIGRWAILFVRFVFCAFVRCASTGEAAFNKSNASPDASRRSGTVQLALDHHHHHTDTRRFTNHHVHPRALI